ncbi:pilin [Pseudomonas aeruginosa]|uniref:pilin n=2 Tax=Pseudomonas aeruginosa TaxID=287 RepID=UPI0022DE5125|nr:pilin [Pseudomonas aeruginosa]
MVCRGNTWLLQTIPKDTQYDIGFTESTLLDGSGKSQIQVTDNKDGTVELVATLGKSSGSAIKGAVITVSRKNDGVWNCKITKTPTAWKPNYAPANCPKS